MVDVTIAGLCVAGMIVVDNPGNDTKAYWPIMHADWNGWTPADFIFPSFLFLVGISLVFSTASRLERRFESLRYFAVAVPAADPACPRRGVSTAVRHAISMGLIQRGHR